MAMFSTGPGFEAKHIFDAFDWAAINKGIVVDVGGSHGSLSIEIARSYPDLSFIVQDQAEIAREGRKKLPKDLANQVSFMAHDFFTDQPVLDADVYLLRWILHDWSDKYAIRILQALRPALKDGAKVVIMEQVLPDPGSIPCYQERGLRLESALSLSNPAC